MAQALTVPEIQELTDKYRVNQARYSSSQHKEWLTFHLADEYTRGGSSYRATRDPAEYLSILGWEIVFHSAGVDGSFYLMARQPEISQ